MDPKDSIKMRLYCTCSLYANTIRCFYHHFTHYISSMKVNSTCFNPENMNYDMFLNIYDTVFANLILDGRAAGALISFNW